MEVIPWEYAVARKRFLESQDNRACSRVHREQTRWTARKHLAALALGVAVLGVAGCGGNGEEGASCAAGLEFRGANYVGVVAQEPQDVELTETLGMGSTTTCVGDGQAAANSGDDVEIRRVRGVSPTVGVAITDAPEAIYVLPGRCDGFDGWDGFWDCLQRSLRIDSRTYTARKLLSAEVDAPAADGDPFDAELVIAGAEAEEVAVVALTGIRPAVAVARADDPTIVFVADDSCHVARADQLLDCLRDASG